MTIPVYTATCEKCGARFHASSTEEKLCADCEKETL